MKLLHVAKGFLMRPTTWVKCFARGARFDKIKLSFPDTHPIHTANIDEAVSAAVGRLRAENPDLHIHLPKITRLPPSPNKPNGKYIVEFMGYVAEAVRYLPAGWLSYVTYADVKTFQALNPSYTIDSLTDVFTLPGAYRNYAPVYPGSANKSTTKQRTVSHRLGSCKSGMHLTAYQRPNQPVGFEGKFRDEAVHNVTMIALDLHENKRVDDEGAWIVARYMWGTKAGEGWAQELYARQLEPSQLTAPITWEMFKLGYEYGQEVLDNDDEPADAYGEEY